MNNQPIGILDSGSGGLSIWRSLVKLLPGESTIYVGDHAYLPYGARQTVFIRQRVLKLIKFLKLSKVKLVIVACNAATVAGIEVYRKHFPGLPLIGVVPVVKTAARVSKTGRFAILSTSYTAGSAYQQRLIKKFAGNCRVYNLVSGNLVSYVERGQLADKQIRRELCRLLPVPLMKKIDVLVLGCTHYPFLRRTFSNWLGKEIQILDSGGAVARQTKRILEANQQVANQANPSHRFFTTGGAKQIEKTFNLLLQKRVAVAKIKV